MRSLPSHPGPAPSARKRNQRSPGLQPHVPAQVHRPTRKRSVRRAAQRSAAHGEGLAGCAGGCGLAVLGGRAGARRAWRGTRGATRAPARPRSGSRPPATHVRRGSPWSRSGPRRQVRPTYSTPGAAGRPAATPAGRTTRRRAPPGAAPAHRVKPSGLRPGALPKSPRRRRRGSATAHHVLGPRRRRRLTAALRAPGRRAGGARAQAVDRRNRRAQQPKELEPERAGLRRPSPGQRPRRTRLPSAPLHLQRSPGLWRGAGSCAGPPPGAFRVADASGNFMEVSPVLSWPPLPWTARATAVERVGRGKQRSLRLRQGATD